MRILQASVIALIIFMAVTGQQHSLEKTFDIGRFPPIPTQFNHGRDILYNQIKTDGSYDYWKVNEAGKVIPYKGDSLKSASQAKKYHCDKGGFFVECMPGYCYSYIVAFKAGKPESICTERDLAAFIGRVDNIEEAILIAKIHDFWFDSDNKKGGAYLERKDDYLLYLLDWSSKPVTYKSVRAILKKNGGLEVIDKTLYYENKGVYISH